LSHQVIERDDREAAKVIRGDKEVYEIIIRDGEELSHQVIDRDDREVAKVIRGDKEVYEIINRDDEKSSHHEEEIIVKISTDTETSLDSIP
jgi:hypothetical protein